ncbi:hypothetical protein GI582_23500 [Sulfitobacter sp. BDSS02]|uniref:hypothetical protein n=1 Tax=Heliomarina sp. TaxID=2917556 RepID=UPI0040593BD3|nr:hypothetical protein [Sulfitobacter sp. BDSS02]MBR9852267.1 hypothetical protein [Paracoccaceae bacterium]
MRKPFRYTHLAVALLIGAYVYSPTLSSNLAFQALIQFGVFPIIALSGIAMWQQPRWMKLIRRTQS